MFGQGNNTISRGQRLDSSAVLAKKHDQAIRHLTKSYQKGIVYRIGILGIR
jgi:hypothetical protein